jgi:hypothetical protein
MKRVFIGPCHFHIYIDNEETTNHLLDKCSYTKEIWDWVAGIFCQSNRIKGNISATINNWNAGYSENEMVNLYWNLTSSMIIWAIWKERNRCIFRNERILTKRIKETIVSQIREIVQSHNYKTEKGKLRDQDS